jgi:RHS repeat-associated protein
MGYTMDYYLNGNVKSRKVTGNYRLNYPLEVREMNSVYTYDKANRLTNVDRFNVKSYSPVEAFSYDKDGNLQTLTRDYSGDNFTYRYYSGTNRLMNITGTEVPQYIYDYNGNVTADSVRKITGITYDYRNLPVEMNITPNNGDRYKYKMRYKYDEAGNRIRKMKYRSRLGEENWTLYNDEVYIRDAKGNETAMYENSNLQYINIWGAGLEGKVRKDDRGNNLFSYYYKDHLGSVTAVMDGASGTITQSQDYDAWGDICRTYSTTDTTVNKFTGKERDTETGYDYFGARYYDSRISVWLSPDPLFEKHLQWSPYNYVLRNPFVLIDPDGRQVNVKSLTQEHRNAIIQDLLIITGYTFQMNSDGYLKIDNSKEVSGGSEIGRKLAKEIDSYDKSVIQVVEHSCTYRSSFYDGNNGGISLNPLEIESNTNPDNVMNGLNIHTFGWGMVFLHELLHSKFKGWDPDDKNLPQGTIGDIEKFLNRIRVQLGKDWGQIQTHTAYRQTIDGTEYGIIPFSKEVIKALESYEFKTKEKYIKSEILIDFEK